MIELGGGWFYDWLDRFNVGARGKEPRQEEVNEQEEEQDDVAEISEFNISPVYGQEWAI